MKKYIWAAVGLLLLCILGFLLVQARNRQKQEVEKLKKADKTISNMLADNEAAIETKEEAIKAKDLALKTREGEIEALKEEIRRLNSPIIAAPKLANVSVEPKEEVKPLKTSNSPRKGSNRKANSDEITLQSFLAENLTKSQSNEEKIKLLEEFLADPRCRVYKGWAKREYNKLTNKVTEG